MNKRQWDTSLYGIAEDQARHPLRRPCPREHRAWLGRAGHNARKGDPGPIRATLAMPCRPGDRRLERCALLGLDETETMTRNQRAPSLYDGVITRAFRVCCAARTPGKPSLVVDWRSRLDRLRTWADESGWRNQLGFDKLPEAIIDVPR